MCSRREHRIINCHCSHDIWPTYWHKPLMVPQERLIVRNEDTENGFEIWRRLQKQFSLTERARATESDHLFPLEK